MRTQYSGLDVTKYVASLFVICIHFNPLTGHAPYDLALNNAARFAVPFFFIASGYLFFVRLQDLPRGEWGPAINTMLRRLVGLLVFWWILNIPTIWSNYIAPNGFWVGVRYYRTLLDRGVPWTPAWFFVALIIAMLAVSTARRHRIRPALIALAALPLFVVGVIASQYLGYLPTGIQTQVWQFNGSVFSLQAGPVTGIFWVAVGSWLADRRRMVHDSPVAIWWTLLIASAGLAWWECSRWVNPGAHGFPDQYVALLPLAVSLFVVSLRWPWAVPGAVFLRNASTVNFVSQYLLVWFYAHVLGHTSGGWPRMVFIVAGALVFTAAVARARRIRVPALRRALSHAY